MKNRSSRKFRAMGVAKDLRRMKATPEDALAAIEAIVLAPTITVGQPKRLKPSVTRKKSRRKPRKKVGYLADGTNRARRLR